MIIGPTERQCQSGLSFTARLRPAIDSVRRARRAGHFYTAGLEHSPTSSTGTGWEQTPLRARKLYVVVPKLTTDNSDDGVLMDDSVYPQMVAQTRRAQKERLELWLPWIPLITALTALTARRH